MKINIITIGKNMPAWVTTAYQEYIKRLPKELTVNLIELPHKPRTKTTNLTAIKQQEAELIKQAIPAKSYVIALDERGQEYTTEQFASKLQQWRESFAQISLIIGGPDGLDTELKQQADTVWSLAKLTLPHPLVRVVLSEQLYRAWSILQNHPYHRA